MCKDSGFTLLELLTVIAILVILSAIAMPNFIGWLPNYRLRSAARDLQSNMQHGRLSAVKENADVIIEFFLGSDSYRTFVDVNDNGSWDVGVDRNIKFIEMPAGIEMYDTTFTTSKTRFNYMGLPSGYEGSISIKNNQNRYRKITVSSAGNSRIEKSIDGIKWY